MNFGRCMFLVIMLPFFCLAPVQANPLQTEAELLKSLVFMLTAPLRKAQQSSEERAAWKEQEQTHYQTTCVWRGITEHDRDVEAYIYAMIRDPKGYDLAKELEIIKRIGTKKNILGISLGSDHATDIAHNWITSRISQISEADMISLYRDAQQWGTGKKYPEPAVHLLGQYLKMRTTMGLPVERSFKREFCGDLPKSYLKSLFGC